MSSKWWCSFLMQQCYATNRGPVLSPEQRVTMTIGFCFDDDCHIIANKYFAQWELTLLCLDLSSTLCLQCHLSQLEGWNHFRLLNRFDSVCIITTSHLVDMFATVSFLHLTRVSVKISIWPTHKVGSFLLTILVAVPVSNKYMSFMFISWFMAR